MPTCYYCSSESWGISRENQRGLEARVTSGSEAQGIAVGEDGGGCES